MKIYAVAYGDEGGMEIYEAFLTKPEADEYLRWGRLMRIFSWPGSTDVVVIETKTIEEAKAEYD